MGSQNWGADHSTHALKKDCNWLPFVTFKLDVDPIQEKEMTRLRHRNNIDELLRTQSRFLQINDNEVCFAQTQMDNSIVTAEKLNAVKFPKTTI